jgi:hypothetical protein
MDADWDNLLILDACRHDYFEEVNWLDGSSSTVTAPGTKSWDYMEEHFDGEKFHDTVYVTSNPFSVRLPDGTFHYMKQLLDEWNEDIGTVLPEDVTEAAKRVSEAFPTKRLIVHYMQPHAPHLGETAERYREELDLRGWDKDIGTNEAVARNDNHIWSAAVDGEVPIADVRQAYRETLELVLESVEDLLSEIEGKSIITADHGEHLGEMLWPILRREYGHNCDLWTNELTQVPWHELPYEERKEIREEEPRESDRLSSDDATKRLEALGYKV